MTATKEFGRSATVALAIVLSATLSRAAEPPAKPVVSQQALALAPGVPVQIACATKSVVVATGAANATSGNLMLKLELAAEGETKGLWSILAVDPNHKGSLATMQAETCANGCPLALGEADVQLWAPAPKGVVELGADELLMLAVLKTASLELKVSTFRGQQIEALESGTCRAASEPDKAEPAKP
ncbi:MAG: hypothetical protein JNM89_08185 [Hyphomicrobiaceae bacterium]|nr:hypothetical protein [Hyphomicrobiaceae bacterium]